MNKHDKSYESGHFNKAYNTFKNNFDLITTWNQQKHSSRLGLNKFADLSNKEFILQFTNAKGQINHNNNNNQLVSTFDSSSSSSPIPISVDWTKKGVVSAVPNTDADCLSSYAFSSVGCAESMWAIYNDFAVIPLSVQQVLDCSGGNGNEGCNGGEINNSFEYMIVDGLQSAKTYPFKGKQQKCQADPVETVAAYSNYTTIAQADEQEMAQAVATHGPVSVYIDASGEFQFYESGVYYNAQCSSTNLDHSVLVTGYGVLNNDNYWSIRYALMSKDKGNNCGIATKSSYIIVKG
ncbi:cysteine proteinase 5 [Cavenderia fasciculata]|uniref:Cysteine proteinase 5 n=1 Tax=Cavenderia fasciculata TaxID=261658 RepID=F4QF71_CACFS|nr:cysteine proteinase 5 [Cavenderia fasciculata]EGG14225.1 cysteine proteinase 5 [Cavenderia fasciculata]|eukprot:XP_004350933.1 cysteine proteinase 5 [Cavenderia fasciculata]